jgi:hypothetical protein
LREKCRLRLFENRVLRRIFGPKMDYVTGEWRKLYNQELNNMYSAPNIIREIASRKMRWGRACSTYVERRGAYRLLVWKPEGKRPLGRTKRRWEDNIKMNRQEGGCGYMDCIVSAQFSIKWKTDIIW